MQSPVSLVLLLLALTSTCLSRYSGHHDHSHHQDGIDDMMDVSNEMSRHGRTSADILVTARSPMMANRPAYNFRGRGICLDDQMSRKMVKFVEKQCNNSRCFSLSTHIRVEKKQATGVVLSLRSGRGVVFDVVFKRNVQLRVRHLDANGHAQWDRLYFEFQLDQWYHFILTVCPQTGLVTFHIDCNQIYQRQWSWGCAQQSGMPEACIGKLANSETDQPPFTGSIQEMQLHKGNHGVDTLCPGCEHSTGNSVAVNAGTHTKVAFLQQVIAGLRNEIKACKSNFCTVNGTVYGHGQTMPSNRPCVSECKCKHGKIACTPEGCPPLSCRAPNQVLPAAPERGRCCPACLRAREEITEAPTTSPAPFECMFNGRMWAEGSVMYAAHDRKQCHPCTCVRGVPRCTPVVCPMLACPMKQQFKLPIECCPACVQHNRCENGNAVAVIARCGRNARCINKPNNRTECQCLPGTERNRQTNQCQATGWFWN